MGSKGAHLPLVQRVDQKYKPPCVQTSRMMPYFQTLALLSLRQLPSSLADKGRTRLLELQLNQLYGRSLPSEQSVARPLHDVM